MIYSSSQHMGRAVFIFIRSACPGAKEHGRHKGVLVLEKTDRAQKAPRAKARSDPEPPKLPQQPEPGGAELIAPEAAVEGMEFLGLALAGAAAGRLSLRRTRLQDVNLRGCRWEQLEATDVVFENCDLSGADLSGAFLCRVQLRGCRLTGLDLSASTLRDTLFAGCTAAYANFGFVRGRRVVMKDCGLTGADLHGAEVAGLRLEESRLTGAQLSGTSLAGLDLRSCEIEGMGARPEDLAGAIVTPVQAVGLAKLLGLDIRD